MSSTKPAKIISGGQTGADRAGLDWAATNHIPIGGWCPRGRRSEDGEIPHCYPLTETPSRDYSQRTELNVVDSHITIIITGNRELEGGSAKTAHLARAYARPFVHIHPPVSPEMVACAKQVIEIAAAQHGQIIVNVAGSRKSKYPEVEALTKFALDNIFSTGPGIKIYLDDCRPKPAGFDVCPKTERKAIQWMETCRVSHISFDHDLGAPENGTGYGVAAWIEKSAHSGKLPPMTWEIHSSNPVGRENIQRAMKSAERFWTKR